MFLNLMQLILIH